MALNASKEEIDLIEKIFNEIDSSKNLNSFVIKDLEFHLTIAKATHNPFMNGLMKIIGEMLYKETQKITKYPKIPRKIPLKPPGVWSRRLNNEMPNKRKN